VSVLSLAESLKMLVLRNEHDLIPVFQACIGETYISHPSIIFHIVCNIVRTILSKLPRPKGPSSEVVGLDFRIEAMKSILVVVSSRAIDDDG